MNDLLIPIIFCGILAIAGVLLVVGVYCSITKYADETLSRFDTPTISEVRPSERIDDSCYITYLGDPYFRGGYRARDNGVLRSIAASFTDDYQRERWLLGWDLSDQDFDDIASMDDDRYSPTEQRYADAMRS